ncbi:MAG: ElyC/SanA/YdcF family protein [Nostocaceae cyanobacterium]|nr:ElyC/SanA/YdcF family protein [Nostocaceae cyanobacterium]
MSNQFRRHKNIFSFRLITRKQVWTLTLQGWVLICTLISGFLVVSITQVHSFLAPNQPIAADILIVEGWMPDYAIEQAVKEFNRGGYRQIIATGGSLEKGSYITGYKSFADVTAATLKILGVPPEKIVAVPTKNVVKDRTYASAAEFRQWLNASDLNLKSVNLVSFDVHSRRSWMLFQKILEPEVKVGIISAQSRDYEPSKWWKSSYGVRFVLNEAIAYIYAQFFSLTT